MIENTLRTRLEPIGIDKFEIVMVNESGVVRHRLRGPNGTGYSEEELRSAGGLPKCGLTETQIDASITTANAKRND